jgi:hypothetical protein
LNRQREAGQRYQQSRAGRHKHAARMNQWRKRRAAAAAKIVTHHSSQATPADAVLAGNESPTAILPDSQPPSPCSPTAPESIALGNTAAAAATVNTISNLLAPVWRCHWCQSLCPALVRQGFLRYSRGWRDGRYP